MVSSNVSDSAESLKWEFKWYAKRDRTGDAIYSVYENGGFYNFYTQEGENLHTHSVRMGLSTEGFSPCELDGSTIIKQKTRDEVSGALV
jgi:hypothetical protein